MKTWITLILTCSKLSVEWNDYLLVHIEQFLARGGRGNGCKKNKRVYMKPQLDYKTKFINMPNFL